MAVSAQFSLTAMWQRHSTSLLGVLIVLFLTVLGRFLAKLYYWRTRCHSLPGPPHSLLLGHLPVLAKVMSKQPRASSSQCLMLAVARQYNLPDGFYIDTWPLGPPMLVAMHPELSNQFTVKQSLPKHPVVANFTQPLAGRLNMVAADGAEWKTWRSAFNPGFSASNLMTLLPAIVDNVSTFCQILERKAEEGKPFRMEPLATRLTIDIIIKIVLDLDSDSQLKENELVAAFESQVRWLPVGTDSRPLEPLNFLRPLVLRYNSWRMDRYAMRELDKRFSTRTQRPKTKHVVDLALETYLKENEAKGSVAGSAMDSTFRRKVLDQIKIFLFAGHDTSSSAICYCYYHLSLNKHALDTVRKEIDTIFSPDPAIVAEMIRDDPRLLNKMEYGLAVIREALRLHPPANAVRMGNKNFHIVDPQTNEQYETDGFMLWASNMGIGRNPRCYGPDPDTFRPERWLDPSARDANVDGNVVFSKGPRNCIGQELALLELRMVLAMTIQKFDFTSAYHELDQLRGDGSGYPSDTSGIQEQFGEQAYQIQLGTAKPREGLPFRVEVVA